LEVKALVGTGIVPDKRGGGHLGFLPAETGFVEPFGGRLRNQTQQQQQPKHIEKNLVTRRGLGT